MRGDNSLQISGRKLILLMIYGLLWVENKLLSEYNRLEIGDLPLFN